MIFTVSVRLKFYYLKFENLSALKRRNSKNNLWLIVEYKKSLIFYYISQMAEEKDNLKFCMDWDKFFGI